MKLSTSRPPDKPGVGAGNRIGTLGEQLRRISLPRPKVTTPTRTDRKVEILEGRVAELERLVLILLERRGAC